MRHIRPILVTSALALAASLASAAPQHAAKAHNGKSDYCTATGGVATAMHPWAGTNGDVQNWVPYGGQVAACTYTAADSSQIVIWDATLSSRKATMAALAYYAQVPASGGEGNPADAYCLQLGGAWQVGNGLDGGGWANGRGQQVYGMCAFADGSAIDAWGLLYHAYSIVRGQDLSQVLKFANPY